MFDERGQSTVLGTVLLLGFALATVSTIVVIGGASLTDLEQEATFERAEAEMAQLDAQASRVALGESKTQRIPLESDRTGGTTISDGGRIWLVTDEGDVLLNESLGTVTYRQNDDVVAYQGGGVWRGTGRQTRMVSPPEIHYRDGTLTLPVVRVVPGNEDVSPGHVLVESGPSEYGLGPGHVENAQVSLIVQSAHYQGWADYMESRASGSVTELDHDNRVAVIDLGHLTIDGNFETGLVAQGDVDASHPGATTDTDVRVSGEASGDFDDVSEGAAIDLQTLDDGIEHLVNDSRNSDPNVDLNTTQTIDDGTYYTDAIHLDGETLTVNVSEGNATVFVDGHVGISGNGGIEVVGDDSGNSLRVFSLGDFALANGNARVSTEGDAGGFQLYGTSEMHFGVGQGNFTGAVYAPREEPASGDNEAHEMISPNSISCANDVDVCLGTGNPTVEGSIVAGPMEVAQSATFDYDEELVDVRPSLPPDADLPPPLTFLHVSVNELQVSGPSPADVDSPDVDVAEYLDE